MEPTNAQPPSPGQRPSPGQQQAVGWPPGSGGYPGQQQPTGKVLKKGRLGLIVLVSLLAEIVFIAAGANQGVTDYVTRHSVQTSNKFLVQLAYAGLTYRWRFKAQNSLASSEHVLVGQFALIGVVLVVTALLLLAIARGAVTFGRVFFGTWMSVIVATQLGAIARGFIIEEQYGGGASGVTRATFAFFGGLAPTGSTFLGSVGLGLLVALVAAIVAISSRRQAGMVVPQPAAPDGAAAERLAPRPEPGFFARADQENEAEQTRQFGAPPWAGGREPQGGAQPAAQTGDRPNLTKPEGDDPRGATAAFPVVGSAPAVAEESGPGDGLDFDDEHGRDHDPRPATTGGAGTADTADAAQRSEGDWQATTQLPAQSQSRSQSQSQWSAPTQQDTRGGGSEQSVSPPERRASPTGGGDAPDSNDADPNATDPNATTQLPAGGPAPDPDATTQMPTVGPPGESRDERNSP